MSEKYRSSEQWIKVNSNTGHVEGRVTEEEMEKEIAKQNHQPEEESNNGFSKPLQSEKN